MIDAVAVLLIEDDSLGETKAGKALASMPGIILNKAGTWFIARQTMLDREKAELLVADLNLPDVLDARETAASICRLASHPSNLPIVVFSDVDELAIRQQCMEAGVIAFLKKSNTSPEDLRRAVTKAITRTRRYAMDSEVAKMTKAALPEKRANGA